METSVVALRVQRGFGAVAGVALLVATSTFLPFIYLMILVVVFRSGYFLRPTPGRTQRDYRFWVGTLVVWMVLLALTIFGTLLKSI